MTKLTPAQEEILWLIKEKPGISVREIQEFMHPRPKATVSADLSILYKKGDLRRENKGTSSHPRFRYFYEKGAKPEMRKNNRWGAKKAPKGPTRPALEFTCEELKHKIDELTAWKEEAIRRFPDLAVPPLLLQARKDAAEEYKSDPAARKEILAGHRDNTPLVRGILRVLEREASQ